MLACGYKWVAAPAIRMTSDFTEAGIEVVDVLKALVIGGNVLATRQGAPKRRRRVPSKQETLVRLVGAKGTATFEHLVESFPNSLSCLIPYQILATYQSTTYFKTIPKSPAIQPFSGLVMWIELRL